MERKGALLSTILALTALAACDRPLAAAPARAQPAAISPSRAAAVPRLVDLGSVTCVPCKAMAPILDGLRAEYAGRMEVQFIDVWKDPDAGHAYGVRVIPTQIFYAADGRELARHEGFLGREEILARWKALGVSF